MERCGKEHRRAEGRLRSRSFDWVGGCLYAPRRFRAPFRFLPRLLPAVFFYFYFTGRLWL